MKNILTVLLLFWTGAQINLHAQPAYDWHHDTYDAVTTRTVSAKNIAAGDSDYVYIAGQSNHGVDFDFTAGVARLSDTLHQNAYVAVYTTAGVYARSWCLEQTANGSSQVGDMCIAANGDVLITGYFSGTIDFSPGPASNTIVAGAGNVDSYIARYTKLGQLVWVRTFAPAAGNWVQTLCIKEAAGKIVVGGMFFTTTAATPVDLNPEAGVNNYSTTNCAAGFILNFSSNGTFGWAIGNIGGSVQGIDMNASGNIAATGQVIVQTDFDPGPGTVSYTATCTGPCMGDFFVARYDASGNYQWHYAVGSWWEGVGLDVRIAATNDVYVVGYCGGVVDLDGGPGNAFVNNSGNFCAKYYSTGAFAWARDGGAALEIDVIGNTYLMDHNGTHLISNAGSSYWDIVVGMTSWGGSIALSQNGKILMVWESGVTEDVDPGAGTISVNNPMIAAHAIHLSLSEPTMGTAQPDAGSFVNIYPNPAADLINVEQTANENTAYTILNTAGECVGSGRLEGSHTKIDVSAFANGVYFVRLEGTRAQVLRFVINR